MIWIGIDTGVNTGVAVWDSASRTFLAIEGKAIHEALQFVMWKGEQGDVKVVFEDARQRTWYGTRTEEEDRAKLQGAGSVKRDCKIWEDALTDWGIPFQKVAPKNNMTKLSAEAFSRLTGWKGRTNEHGRDAAMLVFGR